ncbi:MULTISPECIES: hypothetical protein [Methylobacteriaceae]|uniref:hypothetical protein n=1 Tax=Methylobacterium sp. B4 TaxID=1938755 RepID=UPI000D7575ED|nr:hypothetical protein [Methylobacterium sp. B4]PXW60506.1 hypothetical protein BY998_109109 [Methylobacterium sp. B4]
MIKRSFPLVTVPMSERPYGEDCPDARRPDGRFWSRRRYRGVEIQHGMGAWEWSFTVGGRFQTAATLTAACDRIDTYRARQAGQASRAAA